MLPLPGWHARKMACCIYLVGMQGKWHAAPTWLACKENGLCPGCRTGCAGLMHSLPCLPGCSALAAHAQPPAVLLTCKQPCLLCCRTNQQGEGQACAAERETAVLSEHFPGREVTHVCSSGHLAALLLENAPSLQSMQVCVCTRGCNACITISTAAHV